MLKRLRVEQYRCFSELEVDLTPPSAPGAGWTILVGENGTGKTSLLQAIVLALLDPRPLTSLDTTPWRLCRQNWREDVKANIAVTFATADDEVHLAKSVDSRAGSYIEDIGDALPEPPVVLGFSARRRIARPGELPDSSNRQVERVRGLFEPNLPLLADDAFAVLPDAASRRAFAKVVRDVIVHQLADVEQSNLNRMFPLVDSLELRGNKGVTRNQQLLEQDRFVLRYGEDYQARVAVQELSDGYQAMLSIVLEILVQATLDLGTVPDPATWSAIVLIDEIEAHLHPRWQRTVVPLLREVFPLCQFVVTTHSPLIVASARPGEVQILQIAAEGDVRIEVLEERTNALDADEIFDEVFAVPRLASPKFVAMERDYLQAQHAAGVEDAVSPDVEALIEQAWQDRQSMADRP